MDSNDDKPTFWLNRRVPVAVVITLLIQASGVIIWATQLDARVNGIEHGEISGNALNEKFARLEERLDNVKQDMGGIKHQLERLTEHLLKH